MQKKTIAIINNLQLQVYTCLTSEHTKITHVLTRISGMLENTSVMGQGIVLAQSVFVLECRSMNLGMNLGMNTVVVSSYEISCYCIPTIMWLSGYIPLLCQLKVILLIGNIVSRPLNPKPYLVLQLLSNSRLH